MSASGDWARLTRWLVDSEHSDVVLTFEQFESVIGRPLPASARRHAAFWSNSSGYAKAWLDAGYEVTRRGLLPDQIRFVRTSDGRAAPAIPPGDASEAIGPAPAAVLIGCVKSKRSAPAAARDLYTSALFGRRRSYAEAQSSPWFILSAEHGLVRPEVTIAPYDLALADQSSHYRAAWGHWVAVRLEHAIGELTGKTLEVHAGDAYVRALQSALDRWGCRLIVPLAGMGIGEQLAWYEQVPKAARVQEPPLQPAEATSLSPAEGVDRLATFLADPRSSVRLGELSKDAVPRRPGLYSWFVDKIGASDLAAGLGEHVNPGLIYAGQAGATRWPSGRPSGNTLRARVIDMHVYGSHTMSTFRRTLASALGFRTEDGRADESRLTQWMLDHLSVATVAVEDGDRLGATESAVLTRLDPPLNLSKMPSTHLRRTLSSARSAFTQRRETRQ